MPRKRLSQRWFHPVYSVLMTTLMVFWMTLVITLANFGLSEDFLAQWKRAFAVAYFVALPLTYFLGPLTRRLTARLVEPA